MDMDEARGILRDHVERYRSRIREQLLPLLDRSDVSKAPAAEDMDYKLQVMAVWEDREGGDLRVIVSIDDGRVTSWFPLSAHFIMAPDGSLVEE